MQNKKKLYRTISIVSLLVMLIALVALIFIFAHIYASGQQYQNLSRLVRMNSRTVELSPESEPAQPDTESSAPAGTPLPEPETEKPEPVYASIPIDFAYLDEVNSDITAWIQVDGTGIDYPVLYDDTKDQFYLNHNYSKSFTMAGSVFMLGVNSSDFSDFNTVIYGHNLINGAMFGCLHDFEQQAFFDEHDTILVYLSDRVLRYQIFAAYRTDNKDQVLSFDFSTPDARQEYIDRIFTHEVRALFRPDAAPTAEDRILTLSTCIGNPAYRYLVQGKLIEDTPGRYEPEE